jgi:hypothetical protein
MRLALPESRCVCGAAPPNEASREIGEGRGGDPDIGTVLHSFLGGVPPN